VRASLVLFAAAVAACDSPFVAPPPTVGGGPLPDTAITFAIFPDSANLFVDDTVIFAASARDKNGQEVAAPVTWSSPDTAVVTVLQTGMVIATDSGQAVVHASTGALTDSVTIRVSPVVYQSVASGARHSCAVGTNARVYCWGSDLSNQLGVTPPVLERPAPTPIAAGAVFVALAAGDAHTCALDLDHEIHCWGANDQGQLGRGGEDSSALPSLISSGTQYVALSAGGAHTCAQTPDGTVACWGRNASGELAVGDTVARPSPVIAAEGQTFTDVSTGSSHTCGVTTTGVTLCWGGNALGQLGDSTLTASTAATPVRGGAGPGYGFVAAGGNHTCAIASGATYCWGSNLRGESGTGSTDTALVEPQLVSGTVDFRALTLGSDFTCGLGSDSLAFCWGANDRGQLGDGTQTDHATPAAVSDSLHFAQLSAGGLHVCGVTAGGTIYCWGDNTSGQLGLGAGFVGPLTTAPKRIPFPP